MWGNLVITVKRCPTIPAQPACKYATNTYNAGLFEQNLAWATANFTCMSNTSVTLTTKCDNVTYTWNPDPATFVCPAPGTPTLNTNWTFIDSILALLFFSWVYVFFFLPPAACPVPPVQPNHYIKVFPLSYGVFQPAVRFCQAMNASLVIARTPTETTNFHNLINQTFLSMMHIHWTLDYGYQIQYKSHVASSDFGAAYF
jgi:hypothetical protein